MLNSNPWLQHINQRLQSNSYHPLAPEIYQAEGYRYAVRRTRFELSKFGMAETFFTFAEIPNLAPETMRQFSSASFQFAKRNKAVPLPCGLFESVFCFAVAITANLHPQTAQFIRDTPPTKHWAASEIPVAFDLAHGTLCYFEKTPVWGAAYYNGFRKEVQRILA